MSDLIARLETVAPPAVPGDWLDVVARAEGERRRTMRKRLIVAIAAALLAVPAIAIATHYWDVLSLSATEEEVPLPEGENTLGYVIGDRLQLPGRPPAKLAAPLLAPFVHPETNLVVASPDRTKVVYHSWEGDFGRRNRPPRGVWVLRLFDAATGRDAVVARRAYSPAWRADGMLAYSRPLLTVAERVRRRQSGPSLAHVIVRRAPGRPPVRWSTSPGEWRVLAWAGRHLLALASVRRYDENVDTDFTDYYVHAFTGPGRSRRLPLGDLIAVSPDGRYVFGHASTQGAQGSDALLRLVEVSSGRVVDEIRVDSGPGAWVGDTIILTTGFAPEPIPSGPGGLRFLPGPDHVEVVVLRVTGGKLVVERELRLSRSVIEATGLRASNFYFGFEPPAIVDEKARQFTAMLVIHNTLRDRQIETMLVYLTCDRIELRCRHGRSLDPNRASWSSLVSNPSRPLPD